MSQIDYANRAAQRPGLGPLTSSEKERETATKNRAWATVPLSIALTVHLFFLLQYWLSETANFPNSQWWMTQLAPLASPWLTSRGEPQVPAQYESGLAPAVMLVAGFFLVTLVPEPQVVGPGGHPGAGRGRPGQPGHPGPAAGHRREPHLDAERDVAPALDGRRRLRRRPGVPGPARTPPPKNWRSGLPALVGLALMGPLPTAVGRSLFAPELRDMAVSLQGNTVALRLSALWTISTLWLYLSGLLVGVSLWVLYRWWPLRRGTQVTGLLIAMAMMLIITSAFGLTAARLAGVRTTQIALGSPAAEPALCAGPGPDPRATRASRCSPSG